MLMGCVQAKVMLAGVGFSFLLPDQEVAYARMTDIRVRATSNKVRRTLEWCCKSLQVTPPPPRDKEDKLQNTWF